MCLLVWRGIHSYGTRCSPRGVRLPVVVVVSAVFISAWREPTRFCPVQFHANMKMKGYLCSEDGLTALCGNSMTIGRQNCDINIDDPRVESCHAVLELNAERKCYVLRDLDTLHGTYVNDSKVQNNSVIVTDGDTIRFGEGGKLYELRLADSCTLPQDVLRAHTRISSKTPCREPLPEICLKQSQPRPLTRLRPPPRPRSACELDRLRTHIPVVTQEQMSTRQTLGNQFLEAVLKPKLQSILEVVNKMDSVGNLDELAERKDAIVSRLRDQVSDIYLQISENKLVAKESLAHNLRLMEKELEGRCSEVSLLRQQLDSVMQFSPTMTTQVADKEKVIHELRHDLDKAKQDCSMSQGLIQSLQRELSVQKAENKCKTNEIKQLKLNLRDKDIQFHSLTSKLVRVHDCQTKDQAMNSVNEEMKTLKRKVQRLESRSSDHMSLMQRYKNEIQQLNEVIKKQENEKESSARKAEEQKGKYLDLQRTERLLRVDVEQAKSRITQFRGKISRVLYSGTGNRAVDYPEDSRLIVDLEEIVRQREKDKVDIKSLTEEIKQNKMQFAEREAAMHLVQETVEDILTSLSTNGHHVKVLKSKMHMLDCLELEESVSWIKQSLIDILASEEKWLNEIYEALQKANYNIEVAEKTPAYFVSDLHQNLLAAQTKLSELSMSVIESEARHREEMDKKERMAENTLLEEKQKVREEENEKCKMILEELRAELGEKHDTELRGIGEKLEMANQVTAELKEVLSSKEDEILDLEQRLQEGLENLEKSRESEIVLKEDLKTILLQQKEENQVLSKESSFVKQEFDREIKQYKEEIKQHSITIVQMEERLQSIMQQLHQAQEEADQLRAELKESDKAKHRLAPSPPAAIPVVIPPVINIGNYEQTIAVLRSELLSSQTQLNLQQTDITNLRKELASSRAKMSDMRGELSEPLKEQLENGHKVIKEKELENVKLKEALRKMSNLVDHQKAEISTIRQKLKETKLAVVPHCDGEHPEKEVLHPEPPSVEKTDIGTQESLGDRVSSDLTSLGAECRGDRHKEVIQRQREALAELRTTIKALNNAPFVAPGNEELSHQVFLLKKELAEIRAGQVMEKDTHFRNQLAFSSAGDGSARDFVQTRLNPIDAEVESTARLQLEDTLNMSEQSYMDICNVIGGLLNISAMSGMRSANHLPIDERQKLSDDRRRDLESISQQIKSITNRLERKDNLLQNYDKDLAKLREAEEKATQKTAKVNVLLDEITTKTEENDHLREALRRAEERLNQEKRLNTAIKDKKTFHLEGLDKRYPLPRHNECVSSEVEESALKSIGKKQRSNLRKKEYEIQVLRQKLRSQEQDLCRTSAQATNLQQQREALSPDSSSDSSRSLSTRSREKA